jgi:hypothetical protein
VGPRTGLEDLESRKILPVPKLELRPRTPVASRYTDCVIPAPQTAITDCSVDAVCVDELDASKC